MLHKSTYQQFNLPGNSSKLFPGFLKIILFLILVLISFENIAAIKFGIHQGPRGTLLLKNDNLSCLPYDCSIKLKSNETLKIYKENKKVIELSKNNKPSAYYFYTSDIVDIPAYSGKPIGVLLAIDLNGKIILSRLIEHDEPILLTGIPESKLIDAINGYLGLNIKDNILLKKNKSDDIGIDMITGATVTTLVVNQSILSSARDVARETGILKDTETAKNSLTSEFKPMTWEELLKTGGISHLRISQKDMDEPQDEQAWLDIYFADIKQPSIGINLLGKDEYQRIMSTIKNNQSVILLVANGSWNFKGSAFVRGGIYDRFQIEQNLNTFTFRDVDYKLLYQLEAENAPSFKQRGLFILNSSLYRTTKPWKLVIVASKLTGVTAVSKEFKTFSETYSLPKQFIKYAPKKSNASLSLIQQIWQNNTLGILWYLSLWFIVIVIFSLRKKIAKNKKSLDLMHNIILLSCILTLGLYQQGQPSVVNVFTMFHIGLSGKSMNLYLLEPFIAISWIMIVLTTIVWGRSLFCGWICPFGALQELAFKLRKWIYPFKKLVDFKDSQRKYLKYIRYIIFFVLFIISFFSMTQAEFLSEIEPFKTTWNVGLLNRPAIYGIYVVILIVISSICYRFFCRYICPLGAGLAVFSFFPFIKIPRRNACVSCKLCANDCEPKAINHEGKINHADCLGCFHCINKLYDKNTCPPLKKKSLWIKFNEKEI